MSHSKKRSAENQNRKGDNAELQELDELEFEDPYGDDYDEDDEEAREQNMEVTGEQGEEVDQKAAPTGPPQVVKQVWKAGVEKLEDIEELEYDPSAYIMYHSMQTEWPCLSFDLLKDDLGDTRQRVWYNNFLLPLFNLIAYNKLTYCSFLWRCLWWLDPKLIGLKRIRLPY